MQKSGRSWGILTGVLASVFTMASITQAANFSFTGTFTQDDNIQLFNFTVAAPSTVTLLTYSYAGGTNAAGTAIAAGGFDPILALFDSGGARINQNDDGGLSVPADATTGAHFDTFLQSSLGPGTYTVSVMQYNNFAGATLSDPFSRQGLGNFTPNLTGCSANAFCDVRGGIRTNAWAFDILGVASATQTPPTGTPEATSLLLLGLGLVGLEVMRRKDFFNV